MADSVIKKESEVYTDVYNLYIRFVDTKTGIVIGVNPVTNLLVVTNPNGQSYYYKLTPLST